MQERQASPPQRCPPLGPNGRIAKIFENWKDGEVIDEVEFNEAGLRTHRKYFKKGVGGSITDWRYHSDGCAIESVAFSFLDREDVPSAPFIVKYDYDNGRIKARRVILLPGSREYSVAYFSYDSKDRLALISRNVPEREEWLFDWQESKVTHWRAEN